MYTISFLTYIMHIQHFYHGGAMFSLWLMKEDADTQHSLHAEQLCNREKKRFLLFFVILYSTCALVVTAVTSFLRNEVISSYSGMVLLLWAMASAVFLGLLWEDIHPKGKSVSDRIADWVDNRGSLLGTILYVAFILLCYSSIIPIGLYKGWFPLH